MKILVTGATGQLGSAVARALKDRGDEVLCLVRNPDALGVLDDDLAVHPGDVTDPASLRAAVAGCQAVVHLAGIVSYWPPKDELLRAVNVEGTRKLLEAATDAGVERFLLTSSIAALGWVRDGDVGDEDTPYNWDGLGVTYCETKKAQQDLVLATSTLNPVAVLPGICFGAKDLHQNAGRMLINVAKGTLPGSPPGATTAAVLDDVVAGHLLALDRGKRGEAYVLGGTTATFHELFGRIAAVLGVPAPKRVLSRFVMRTAAAVQASKAIFTGEEPQLTQALAEMSVRNRRYSSDKARGQLGYTTRPLEDGIEACAAWYRERGWL